MNKKFLLLMILLVGINCVYAQSSTKLVTPEHVILNLTETPENSIAVTWRTHAETEQFVEWLDITDSPAQPDENQSVKAKSETVTYIHSDLPITVTNHSAIISGLKAGTKYIYRVGAGNTWSEWYEFKTAGTGNELFSFIYFGDAQNNIKSHWSRVIRKAYSMAPEAGFMLHAGDLINRTNSESEWQEWFHAGDFIHAAIPSIMTPGNHEYDSTALDNHWRPQFTLPANGANHPLLSETCYFVDYHNLRVISIDSDIMTEAFETVEITKKWLEKVLENNPKEWTILTLHFPFYSTKSNRDNPELRRHFQPIIEKYKVDMVLTGHDHAYGRGMKNIESMTKKGKVSGPVYVVSVSGPKMYDLSDKGWMTRKAGNTQLFQIISIEGKKMNFKAYTASGELYDEFDLVKKGNKTNKLIDKNPGTPERLYSR